MRCGDDFLDSTGATGRQCVDFGDGPTDWNKPDGRPLLAGPSQADHDDRIRVPRGGGAWRSRGDEGCVTQGTVPPTLEAKAESSVGVLREEVIHTPSFPTVTTMATTLAPAQAKVDAPLRWPPGEGQP